MQLYNALQIDTFQEVNPSQNRGIYIVYLFLFNPACDSQRVIRSTH